MGVFDVLSVAIAVDKTRSVVFVDTNGGDGKKSGLGLCCGLWSVSPEFLPFILFAFFLESEVSFFLAADFVDAGRSEELLSIEDLCLLFFVSSIEKDESDVLLDECLPLL
mmetsp:Transcript_15564/g.35878  ORF Transcript_15564/g.35878 Transcript_15564/m.35878 type:complete len:110 (+) Transcript_15564:302-631(+)